MNKLLSVILLVAVSRSLITCVLVVLLLGFSTGCTIIETDLRRAFSLRASLSFGIITSTMPIKNYTSDKPIDRIFAELQQTLGTHGAKHISFEYGDDGRVHGLTFTIKVTNRLLPVKLPARVEQAQAVLTKQWETGLINHKSGSKDRMTGYEHAYRVAWRNILDWVQAQMALLEIGMAQMEEIFLPFMVIRSGETVFEAAKRTNFLQLDSGRKSDEAEEGEVIHL